VLLPESGVQGESKALWATEWFWGQKRNSIQAPTSAVSSEGLNFRSPEASETFTTVTAPLVAAAAADEVAEAEAEDCADTRVAAAERKRRTVLVNILVAFWRA
jgi:hypothetical protein